MSPPDPPPELDAAGVVLRFLESVGRPDEARFYLDLFRSRPREQFALIAVDAPVLREALDAVVLDLRFLAALGLFPTVALGLIEPEGAGRKAKRLAEALAAKGVAAEVLSAAEADRETVAAAAGRDALPIVLFGSGEGAGPPERFAALGRLAGALHSQKVLMLHRAGGLHLEGELLPLVNVTTEAEALLASGRLPDKQALLLRLARDLVAGLAPARVTAAITSPLVLLRELFTTKGAGTLLRRGAAIHRCEGWDGLDRGRLDALIAASFGRPVAREFFDRPIASAYLEESYRAAAVLQDTQLGSYLTKFLVSPEARGEGLARDLWEALAADHPVVFWRARAANPIHDWYERLCTGLQKAGDWTVYWSGLEPALVPRAIEHALAQPVDLG